MKDVRVRIAPSPTGPFHVGTARTALFNWLFARQHHGVMVLRIEDTDQKRSDSRWTDDIIRGLRWLGLDWDEGPEVGGEYGPYRQSQRLSLYGEAISRLLHEGRAYHCFCTREELAEKRAAQAAAKENLRYDGACRELTDAERQAHLASGRDPVVRLRVPEEGETAYRDLVFGETRTSHAELDDFVIQKSDGYPTYNLAAVVDDHAMQISHVIRGADGISNTPKQLLLYHALEWESPEFAHLPLLLGKDRSKLSKRHGAAAVDDFRAQGYLPQALVNFIALLGWSPGGGDEGEIFTLREFVERWDLAEVNRSGAVFDLEKLEWMNGEYIRSADLESLTELCTPFLHQAGLGGDADPTFVQRVVALSQERMKRLDEIADRSRFFFVDDFEVEDKLVRKWYRRPETRQVFEGLLARLQNLDDFDESAIETTIRGLAEELDLSASKVIHPTRAALTGRSVGPGLFELMAVLGRDRCLARLRRAVQQADSLSPAEPSRGDA